MKHITEIALQTENKNIWIEAEKHFFLFQFVSWKHLKILSKYTCGNYVYI